jgi:transposase
MLSFTGSLKLFVCLESMDMRKGFEGLHAAVGERLKEDMLSGALFVFTNQRRTRLKILYFDGTGLWLMTKRLEHGTFFWPKAAEPGQSKLKLRLSLVDGMNANLEMVRLRLAWRFDQPQSTPSYSKRGKSGKSWAVGRSCANCALGVRVTVGGIKFNGQKN